MSRGNYNGPGVKYSDIVNPNTLNIFTDASIVSRPYGYDGCYGAIAVYNDVIIDEIYRVNTGTTNNNSEIKGVRAGVFLALKYQNQFPIINIFSDSQISIFGIRDRLLNWSIDPISGMLLGRSGQVIQSQDIFLEIVYLMLQYNLRINFIHQKGHVSQHIDSLIQAQHVFEASNSVRGKVDLNMIRFISKWNCVVDETSRYHLLHFNRNMTYRDAIGFLPTTFDRAKFSKLSKNTIKKGVFQ